MSKESSSKEVRLDKWLWAARFYKTRSIAHQAIEGGKVHINGVRAKPSRGVLLDQELRINCPKGEMTVVVKKVASQRVSPSLALELYEETEDSRERREKLAESQRFAKVSHPAEKPNTQDRRTLRRIKHGE